MAREDDTQAFMGLWMLGIKTQRLREALGGLHQFFFGHQNIAQAKMVWRRRWRQRDGMSHGVNGRVRLVTLMHQNTEHVVCLGLRRIDLKNLPVERFRLYQQAGLMIMNGQFK